MKNLWEKLVRQKSEGEFYATRILKRLSTPLNLKIDPIELAPKMKIKQRRDEIEKKCVTVADAGK